MLYYIYACNTCKKANFLKKKLRGSDRELAACVFCSSQGLTFVGTEEVE